MLHRRDLSMHIQSDSEAGLISGDSFIYIKMDKTNRNKNKREKKKKHVHNTDHIVK